MHHEIELGLVIGRRLRDFAPRDDAEALESIACYLLAIDMTARNVQGAAKKAALPWSTAKGFDTFLPMSEPIEKIALPDPYQARLTLDVDGKRRQDDKVELMLFRIPRLLSDISRIMTLEPGDIVLTGTPKGVGPLMPGQKVSIGCDVDGRSLSKANASWMIEDREGGFEYDAEGNQKLT